MQEFVARKLGDVLALAHACIDTIERGKDVLERSVGKYKVKELGQDNLRTITQLTDIAQKAEIFAAIGQHASAFEIKLRSMRDDYMRGEWLNEAKVLESLGFLEGIAVVQWNLLATMATQTDEKALIGVAQQGAALHEATIKMLGNASMNYKMNS